MGSEGDSMSDDNIPNETVSHTPGPWTAVQRSWGYPEVEGGPERRLWEVQGADGLNIAGCTIYSRDEADARLIAAAPSMYEALTKIAAYDPGNFRGMEDEVAIWKIATEVLAALKEIP